MARMSHSSSGRERRTVLPQHHRQSDVSLAPQGSGGGDRREVSKEVVPIGLSRRSPSCTSRRKRMVRRRSPSPWVRSGSFAPSTSRSIVSELALRSGRMGCSRSVEHEILIDTARPDPRRSCRRSPRINSDLSTDRSSHPRDTTNTAVASTPRHRCARCRPSSSSASLSENRQTGRDRPDGEEYLLNESWLVSPRSVS